VTGVYERHRDRVESAGGGRAYGSLMRASVLGILTDSWPRPWRTVDIQAAHTPPSRQAVYVALRHLSDTHGLVRQFRTMECAWWVAAQPAVVCALHHRPAVRLVNMGGSGRAAIGGYACDRPGCARDAMDRSWPDAWLNDAARNARAMA
jgi:hypothetical protein